MELEKQTEEQYSESLASHYEKLQNYYQMKTQRDLLKEQARALEAQLSAATKYGDGIDLMDIYRKLDKVKSLIEAIR